MAPCHAPEKYPLIYLSELCPSDTPDSRHFFPVDFRYSRLIVVVGGVCLCGLLVGVRALHPTLRPSAPWRCVDFGSLSPSVVRLRCVGASLVSALPLTSWRSCCPAFSWRCAAGTAAAALASEFRELRGDGLVRLLQHNSSPSATLT